MTKNKGIHEWTQELLSRPDNKIEIFKTIPVNIQGFVLLNLPKRFQQQILKSLHDKEIIKLIDYLDLDEATDLLQNTSPPKRKRILGKLKKEIKEKIEFLLKFDPSSAAGLMNLDYVEVTPETTFEELSKILLKHEKRSGKIPAILAVDNGFLKGEVPVHMLAIAKKKEKIAKHIKKIPSIKYNQDEKEIISLFKKNPHNKIAVLDENDSIIGIIYSDDILKLIENKSANQLRHFAGVKEEEDVLDSSLTKVKYRYKWLIINLLTAFLAASVVGLFEDTISAFVLLAVYMPIIAGMGGNAATQTLAVVVRGLALKEINPKNAKTIIKNELVAGAINGFINAILVAIVAWLWNKTPLIGLIAGLAMIINLMIAGFFGAIIPMIMKKLGKDPASSATIFITTATDVCGFLAFLGLAKLLLQIPS